MFGLYPRKGVIAPGADADIVVYDPNGQTTIGIDDKHHMNMDHSAYEGFEIDGKVDTVLSRGSVVIEDDAYVGRKGHGRFVERELSQYLVLTEGTSMDIGVVLQTTRRRAGRRPREAGRDVRVQPRLDVRLTPAVAGAVRHLQPDPGETRNVTVGPMVTNPATRDWTVTASAVRDAERDVRQPHGVRHRAAATPPCASSTASRRRSLARCARRST